MSRIETCGCYYIKTIFSRKTHTYSFVWMLEDLSRDQETFMDCSFEPRPGDKWQAHAMRYRAYLAFRFIGHVDQPGEDVTFTAKLVDGNGVVLENLCVKDQVENTHEFHKLRYRGEWPSDVTFDCNLLFTKYTPETTILRNKQVGEKPFAKFERLF